MAIDERRAHRYENRKSESERRPQIKAMVKKTLLVSGGCQSVAMINAIKTIGLIKYISWTDTVRRDISWLSVESSETWGQTERSPWF